MRQKIADLINVIFGFRKFLLMLLVYLIAVVFRCNDLINGAEMVDLLKQTTLGFLGANGVEHIVGAVKDHLASKTAGDNPVTPYEDLVSQEAADAEEEAKNG